MDRPDPFRAATGLGEDFLQQALQEEIPQAVVLARVKQKCEEIRMPHFHPNGADGLKEIELAQQSFQRLQLWVHHHEVFQRLQRSLSWRAWSMSSGNGRFISSTTLPYSGPSRSWRAWSMSSIFPSLLVQRP